MSAPLSQEDYLANPNQCPYCQSSNIEGESMEVDSNISWQRIICNECGKSWTDLYKLIGWEPDE